MADSYLRLSPLAHLHLDARALADETLTDEGVELAEIRHHDMLNIRGDAADAAFGAAVHKALGCTPPTQVGTVADGTGGTRLLALGPDEWLAKLAPGKGGALGAKLRVALDGIHAAVTDVGDGRTIIRLSGRHARDVLAKGTTIDLHAAAFVPGQCAETLIARTGALIHCTAPGRGKPDSFEVIVAISFAEYLWTWLEDAGREYGVRVST